MANNNFIQNMWGHSNNNNSPESLQDPNTSSIMQDDDDKDHGDDASSSSDNIKHPTTMSMQETIAMSLAHSLNNALLLLDDDALSSVRRSQIINTKF